MGKGDNRRPRDERVSDDEYSIRWQRTFSQIKKRDGRPPVPSREGSDPPNPIPESFGEREKGYALLLGDGYTEIKEKRDE